MSRQPIPLWLDCDPGHDDAFAILLAAYHPMINLLGISTVFGNASLEKTTYNATSVLTAISKHDQVKVYQGAPQALHRPPLHAPTDIHGESGIDGTALLPVPLRGPDTSVSAINALASAVLAQPAGTAWIVATGSMTNVAAAFAAHPALKRHIRGLSVMAGAVGGGFTPAVSGAVGGVERIGNWTQWAEFNVLVDPEAADSVLTDPELVGKTTMIPLDVTHLVLATDAVQRRLLYGGDGEGEGGGEGVKGKTTLRVMLVELLNFFAETYRTVFGITAGPPLHDPVAVAVLLADLPASEGGIPFYDSADPGRRERYSVKVNTEGTHEDAQKGAQTGRTDVTLLPEGVEGVRIPRSLDLDKFWAVLGDCLDRADEANRLAGRG